MISLIAAIGTNRELGKGNALLWDLPEDMKFFRETTKGHPVIMGRKTFESIGRVLPKRLNIIVTRNSNYQQEGAVVVGSLEEAFEAAQKEGVKGNGEVFVMGGEQIYTQSLPFANKLYLTLVQDSPEADAFFPEYSNFFTQTKKEARRDGELSFAFTEWEKK